MKDISLLISRRGGRVVEGAALEMLYRGNPIEGSNPSLSVQQGNSNNESLSGHPNFPEI